jgi:integrase
LTVKKRGKHWYFDFQIKGKRYREAIPTATTKWQAEQAETKARSKIFDSLYGVLELGTQLFADFVKDTYLPWAKVNKRSWRTDESVAAEWCAYFSGKTLREISQVEIEKYKLQRMHSITKRGTGRRPASVNIELAVLSRIFSLAVELQQGAFNPCHKVRKLRVDNRRNRYLSAEEEIALMSQLTKKRAHLKPIVKLALGTGMRRGELLSLSWDQVDFARGVVHVTNTKSGKDRMVPMSNAVRELLYWLYMARKSTYVFSSPKRKGNGIVDIKKAFVAACSDAGIVDFHFHDLRHTFATRLGDKGCTATTIAALLGHSNTQMTARYTHATDEALKAAVEYASVASRHNGVTQEKQPPKLVAVNR